jgi:hypothetical protein
MASNLIDGDRAEILQRTLESSDDVLYVVNPSDEGVRTIVEVAAEFDGDLPEIRLLATERTLRDVVDDFIVASHAADMVENGHLSLRVGDDYDVGPVFVHDDWVMALVGVGAATGGLRTDDRSFVEEAYDAYAAEFDKAEEFALRTPPISRVRETLSSEMGPETEAEFAGVLDSLETARGNGDGLDEVTISLLVAAKNQELFYDISRWGEDVGVASKATFSRMKNQLEESGLIGTEKVPVDVGRPRQRLTIQDDRLREADTPQLASVAETILN